MSKEEQKENLYQLLLQRNNFNGGVIRKFYRRAANSKKSTHQTTVSKPLLFPILNVCSQKKKSEKENNESRVLQSICNTYSHKDALTPKISKNAQMSEKGIQIKKECKMRQHFKKETSFEGVIINEKSLTKFMKKKNDDVEQKKKMLKKEYKKYQSQKALLNLKEITFTNVGQVRNSDNCCMKKRADPENVKILAFGNRKVAFKIKNQEITLPPMRFNGNFEIQTINEEPKKEENDNYSDRYMKVRAIPLNKIH